MNLKFVESGTKQEITYTASSQATSLVLDTNAGNRWNLNASMANPLPSSVKICQASDNACGGSGRAANSGSLRFDSDAHTTVNLFDCTRPLSSSCTRSAATEYIRVDNMRVRYMNFDAYASGTGISGHVYNGSLSIRFIGIWLGVTSYLC